MTAPPHLRHSERSCTTADCHGVATHKAAIYDGETDEPTWAIYCDECADVLGRGGDEVRPLPRAESRPALNGLLSHPVRLFLAGMWVGMVATMVIVAVFA